MPAGGIGGLPCPSARLTLFKGMGMGLSDVAVAAVVVAEAERHYVRVVLEQPRFQDVAFTFEGGTAR